MHACVDIGGTKLAVSLAQPGSRQLLHRRAEPTAKEGAPDAVARQILRLLGDACAEAGITLAAIRGVGVSSASPFLMRDGMIEVATPNICGGLAGADRGLPNDWTSFPLEAPLRAHFGAGVPVRVENDAVAALEAERRWGALQGVDHCAYVTWSTGVGMGLCADGRVLRGKNGNAGHGGHTFSSGSYEDPLCGCGNVGDLESLVSGTAMGRRFVGQGFHDAAALLQAARGGEPAAVAIVDELCRILGRALYNVVALLDLQRISLGGSVFWHHREHLLPRLQAELARHLPALTAGVELVPAGLQDKVGDYAALALVD
jgi:glucokinase